MTVMVVVSTAAAATASPKAAPATAATAVVTMATVVAVTASIIVEMIMTIVSVILRRAIIAPAVVAVMIAVVGNAVIAVVVTTATRAQDASGARVGIEPDHASVWRHPLHAVVHLAVAAHERAFGVVEAARMLATDLGKNAIERLRVAAVGGVAVIVLRACRARRERKEKQAQCQG
jgi:hypothetical protein